MHTPTWIDNAPRGRLATAPHPSPYDRLVAHLAAWRRSGAHVVVSLLAEPEARALGLSEEDEHCRALGLEFHHFPITDRGCPDSTDAFVEFVERLHGSWGCDRGIVAHCYAGIGRSTLVAASLLVRSGWALDDALTRISHARGFVVPDTSDQRAWLEAVAPLLEGR